MRHYDRVDAVLDFVEGTQQSSLRGGQGEGFHEAPTKEESTQGTTATWERTQGVSA